MQHRGGQHHGSRRKPLQVIAAQRGPELEQLDPREALDVQRPNCIQNHQLKGEEDQDWYPLCFAPWSPGPPKSRARAGSCPVK